MAPKPICSRNGYLLAGDRHTISTKVDVLEYRFFGEPLVVDWQRSRDKVEGSNSTKPGKAITPDSGWVTLGFNDARLCGKSASRQIVNVQIRR